MTLDPRDLQSGNLLLAEDKSVMHRFEPACCRIRFVVARGGTLWSFTRGRHEWAWFLTNQIART